MISVRYAKALYGYACELKEEERLYGEMKTLADSFASFKALRGVMDNPTVSSGEKRQLLITAGGIEVSKAYRGLVDLVISNRRESYMQKIALEYQEFYRRQKGIIIGKLTTIYPVEKETEEKFKKLIAQGSQSKVDLITKIDPRIIGGFVLEVDSRLLDASIRSQLSRIRKQLTGKNN